MKIRNGFVSNSSSSSFVCNVCNEVYEVYEGYDNQYEIDVYYCCRDHEICQDCEKWIDKSINELSSDINKVIEKLNLIDSQVNDFLETEDKIRWIKKYNGFRLHEEVCPICNLTYISKNLEADFLLEKFSQNRDKIHQEIREKFKNLKGWEEKKK